MNPFVLLLPAFFIAIAVAYGIFHALGRVWLEHRVKLALLKKLESRPELIPSFEDLQELVDHVSAGPVTLRQDFRVTGFFLLILGIGSVVWGRVFSLGRISVGLNLGGLVCVCLGFVLVLLGFLLHDASRSSTPKDE